MVDRFQEARLFADLNPVANMSWDLALHTMVSFLTNTNQQHYSGQAQLSYLSQMTGIVGLQVATPVMGLAMAVAVLRGLFGGRQAASPVKADVSAATVDVGRIGNSKGPRKPHWELGWQPIPA